VLIIEADDDGVPKNVNYGHYSLTPLNRNQSRASNMQTRIQNDNRFFVVEPYGRRTRNTYNDDQTDDQTGIVMGVESGF